MSFSIKERGALHTFDYHVFFVNQEGKLISPFHDIPLYSDKNKNIFNMVVEVPRWTNAKMEISKTCKLNPIKQDEKKGKPRFINNCFPHHGYIWNYGALPQTWENPSQKDIHTGQKGDNDPIDICEIGYKIRNRGEIVPVKVLGIMALIDEGETDWKVIAIDINDPLADKLNDIGDLEIHMPGFLSATHEWFKIYKIPAGKPANQFAFNGEAKNKDFALKIIEETHGQWKALVSGKEKSDVLCMNTTVEGSTFKISEEEAQKIFYQSPDPSPAQPIPQEVNLWHFVKQ